MACATRLRRSAQAGEGDAVSRPFGGSTAEAEGRPGPAVGGGTAGGGSGRTIVRGVRFSPVEWGLLRERARVCGRPPTTYLREVGLGAIPRARPGALERQVVHHLSRIGSNLEQLARLARQAGLTTLARDFEATLVDLRDLLRRLLR